jgi:hypothetical protein
MSNPDLFANEDQAEKGLLASVERRRSNGERPPLGNAKLLHLIRFLVPSMILWHTENEDSSQASSERMKHVVRKVKLVSQAASAGSSSQGSIAWQKLHKKCVAIVIVEQLVWAM